MTLMLCKKENTITNLPKTFELANVSNQPHRETIDSAPNGFFFCAPPNTSWIWFGLPLSLKTVGFVLLILWDDIYLHLLGCSSITLYSIREIISNH